MNGPADMPAHSLPRVTHVATAVGSRSRTRRNLRAWGLAGLFMLPALALYALFVLYPIVQAAHYSLYAWNGLGKLTDIGAEHCPAGQIRSLRRRSKAQRGYDHAQYDYCRPRHGIPFCAISHRLSARRWPRIHVSVRAVQVCVGGSDA